MDWVDWAYVVRSAKVGKVEGREVEMDLGSVDCPGWEVDWSVDAGEVNRAGVVIDVAEATVDLGTGEGSDLDLAEVTGLTKEADSD